MPSRVPLTHRVRTFFFPSGKRRRTAAPAPVPVPDKVVIPPRPTRRPTTSASTSDPAWSPQYVVDYSEIERLLMDRIAADALGVLSSFREHYDISVRRGEKPVTPPVMRTPGTTVTGRVHISPPANPLGWMPRTPKTLVRPTDVATISPTTFQATGLPGLRITLTAPAVDRVTTVPIPRVPESASRISKLSQGRAVAHIPDSEGSVMTVSGERPFPRRETHVCRGCRHVCEGAQVSTEDWQCGTCGHAGHY